MKVLFIEPPKDVWFVMGEYIPPPLGIIQLGAYLESKQKNLEIKVLDCNVQKIDWNGIERYITEFNPDIVASSALATCNTYLVARTLEIAKKVNPNILTVAGGQHFSATTEESLETFDVIDIIIHGEGEQTLTELVRNAGKKSAYHNIKGLSFKHNGKITHNPPRPFIKNLEALPFPGYHLVEDFVHKYHFNAMTGPGVPYALIEGSRGCPHRCTFCSQWGHWRGTWRRKSPKRVADEMEFCYEKYGSRFIWLTDDNFGFTMQASELADRIIEKGLSKDFMWFTQARCDDVVKSAGILPKLRKSGLQWVLLGIESSRQSTLERFRKEITPEISKQAVRLLKENDIFAQAMFIIGEREDSAESISNLRDFANHLDPDFAIFALLTPFPGTKLYEEARANGWIEDQNWSHYDMIHAIMPTETLSRKELQEELYRCYRSFYGSWSRRLQGIFSNNNLKRRVFRYMLRKGIINQLKALFKTS